MVAFFFLFALVLVVVAFFFLFALVLVVVVSALERERDRFHSLGELEDRSSALCDCFQGVLEALLQLEAVGHHEGSVLHALPVTERGLVAVRVAADRDQRLYDGHIATGHVRDDVGPDARRDEDGWSGWRSRSLVVAPGAPFVFVTPARSGAERNSREHCECDPCQGSPLAAPTVNDDGAWTWKVLHG